MDGFNWVPVISQWNSTSFPWPTVDLFLVYVFLRRPTILLTTTRIYCALDIEICDVT